MGSDLSGKVISISYVLSLHSLLKKKIRAPPNSTYHKASSANNIPRNHNSPSKTSKLPCLQPQQDQMSEIVIYLIKSILPGSYGTVGAPSHPKFEFMMTSASMFSKTPLFRNNRSNCSMNLKLRPSLKNTTERGIIYKITSQTYFTHIPLVSDFGNYCPLNLSFKYVCMTWGRYCAL